ncbi:MAG: S-layer homology domain-containing protein, partial [Lawsonibacter sp.]|nr:S-layer homology domain-containing protein [Lawsonibacter sp.]
MRNLKRALSLTLASVMLLGMMVIGTSAVAGYSDVDVNDNVEAIEVLQAVEVMVGDDRGFGPDRPVTRAEMAVVMGKLLNLDYNYYVSTCPFADVSGNYEWARGWVG